MSETVDEVLQSLGDLDTLSFYGLSQSLESVQKLVERVYHVEKAKAPRPEDVAIAERREELLDAQAQLKRTMGAVLDAGGDAAALALTKRERPLAEDFLQEQLTKLQSAAGDPRAAKGMERLREMLQRVKDAAPVPESREVRTIEASIKQFEVEWKEVSPLFDKWQAGRHNFKSNDDLQNFRRRYEDCRKGRESAGSKLERALRMKRNEAAEAAGRRAAAAKAPGAGWASVTKKAPPATRPTAARGVGGFARPARAAPAPSRAAGWGSTVMSLAQRLRAEAGAKVRAEAEGLAQDDGGAEEEEDEDEDEDEEEEQQQQQRRAPPPPPPTKVVPKHPPPSVVPKAPPALPQQNGDGGFVAAGRGGRPAGRPAPPPVPGNLSGLANAPKRWGAATAHESDDDADDAAGGGGGGSRAPAASRPAGAAAASSKKKAKGKKKRQGGRAKEGEEEDDDGDDIPPEASAGGARASKSGGGAQEAFVAAIKGAISGAPLAELLRREAWAGELDAAAAEERCADLAERLPWGSPLGLVLPLEWTEFFGLEIDGGPKRTSKRNASPGAERLQRTIPYLLPHYVTMIFFLTLLHGLSNFGLILFAAAAQVGLLLAPADALPPSFPAAARPRLLQAAHLLLWLFFVRSLWLMHLLVKLLVIGAVTTHAYVVTDISAQ